MVGNKVISAFGLKDHFCLVPPWNIYPESSVNTTYTVETAYRVTSYWGEYLIHHKWLTAGRPDAAAADGVAEAAAAAAAPLASGEEFVRMVHSSSGA